MSEDQMENIYKNTPPDKIPWNMKGPPDILREIVETKKVSPCKTIELGCGTGNYAIYLATKGFDVTGVDFSKTAIKKARIAAELKKVQCTFFTADVLGKMDEVTDTFDFAFDWELLHHIFPEDRVKYVNNVCGLLNPGAPYLSVCFSEESPQFGGRGKYRTTPIDTVLYFSSESEITHLFRPLFEIEEIKTVTIAGKYAPHKAIYAFLRKR